MQVIIVGTDVPDLTAEVIVRANSELTVHDISLGPSEDGGYYLIAMHTPHEGLFRDIQWSTSTVHTATQAAAVTAGLSFAQETSLPRLRDIDFVEVRTGVMAWLPTKYRAVSVYLCMPKHSVHTKITQPRNRASSHATLYAGPGNMGTTAPRNKQGEAPDVGECLRSRYKALEWTCCGRFFMDKAHRILYIQ